jgi:hypothetical protein
MKRRIIASIVIAASTFLFIAGSAAAAPTSTIVQNLKITGVLNAPCLSTDVNGLVGSTTCGSVGTSSTLIFAGDGILVSASGTNGYIIVNNGVTSTANLVSLLPVVISATGTIMCPTCLTTSTGLTIANFASPNISQWTNDSGYITTSTFNPTGTANNAVFWNAAGNGLSSTSSIQQSTSQLSFNSAPFLGDVNIKGNI